MWTGKLEYVSSEANLINSRLFIIPLMRISL